MGADATANRVTPPCAICTTQAGTPRTLWHLTHGIAVWLCREHHADRYRGHRQGRTIAEQLAARWSATGCLTVRRARALQAHLVQNARRPPSRQQPGSYSWPGLRREAERRFAAGHPPEAVIADLRNEHRRDGDGGPFPPSGRTMRRWFAEARWLAPAIPKPSRATRPPRATPSFGRLLLAAIDAGAPPYGWQSSFGYFSHDNLPSRRRC